MWKILQKTPPYFMNVTNDFVYHIFITDYIRIWSVMYTEDLFITCLKESNIGLEIDEKELLDKGNDMLFKTEKLKNISISQDILNLNVSMLMNYGYPLYLKMKLQKGCSELFFQKITQPFLRTIKDLKESEDELRNLLMKKDDEIAEYKSQGGKIKYTALPQYKDSEHMNKHSSFENVFGKNHIPDSVLEITVNNGADIDVKQEPSEENRTIKREPLSQPVGSDEAASGVGGAVKEESVEVDFKTFVPKKKQKRLNI